MGLLQEGLRRSEETITPFSGINHRSSETKTNSLPLAEPSLEVKLREVSRMLSVEQKEEKQTAELQSQKTSKNGFEPFINGGENDENNLFVNLYDGDFSQKMELNRKGIEGVLKIAHLDGKVFLTSLQQSRSRADAQGNELAAKRFLLFENKTQKAEEENPYKRVVSTPEGWRIEINDQKLTEELTEKKIGGKQLQRAFINRFNSQFKGALKECIWKEKMTGIKDMHFRRKALLSVITPGIGSSYWLLFWAFGMLPLNLSTFTLYMSAMFPANVINNTLDLLHKRQIERRNNTNSGYVARKLDSPWEYFMPQVEIDKVARSAAFLAVKGKTLVKEIKQAENK